MKTVKTEHMMVYVTPELKARILALAGENFSESAIVRQLLTEALAARQHASSPMMQDYPRMSNDTHQTVPNQEEEHNA